MDKSDLVYFHFLCLFAEHYPAMPRCPVPFAAELFLRAQDGIILEAVNTAHDVESRRRQNLIFGFRSSLVSWFSVLRMRDAKRG